MPVRRILRRIEALYGDRRVIVIGGPVVILARLGAALQKCGARKPLLLGSLIGTGALPDPEEADWHSLDIEGESMMDVIHVYERTLRDLPANAREIIERYDPTGEAMVLGSIVLGDVPDVAGRRRFAYRPPAWAELEDKLIADRVWRGAEVSDPPFRIAEANYEAAIKAAEELDRGRGTVWAGDTERGIHGGATLTRWIRTAEQAREAAEFFSSRSSRIRVTPFLEGIPTSIHGVVFPDGVASLRPIELLTLRRPEASELVYAGAATSWDPPTEDREAMREAAQRVGRWLQQNVDYRGPFTIDGVLTDEGFLPTELNPRIGAGIYKLAASLTEIPLELFLLGVIEGDDMGVSAEEFEELVVMAADRNRVSSAMFMFEGHRTETEVHPFVMTPSGFELTTEREEADGELLIGPGPSGGFLGLEWHPGSIPDGAPLAPTVVQLLAFAEQQFGIPVGPLEAAQDVRAR